MAFETSQKYKEGKFIIEKARLMKVGYYLQYHYLAFAKLLGSHSTAGIIVEFTFNQIALIQEGNW